MKSIIKIWRICRKIKTSFFVVALKYFIYRLRKKQIICSNKVTIYGLNKISTNGILMIGLRYVGFTNHYDRTFLNIRGKLNINGSFSIAKGCRFDISENAVATFNSGYVNPNTKFIISHGIEIGSECAISWDCQFIDDDFHHINYHSKIKQGDKKIKVGSHVWIGSNVTVLKGSVIPDGCVIASNSVVNSKFSKKNTLIAGNPARIVKQNINWE